MLRVAPRLSRPFPFAASILVLLFALACESSDEPPSSSTPAPVSSAEQASAEESSEEPTGEPGTPGAAGATDAPVVVFLGDSLTAGYGLAEDEAYPALVEDALREQGRAVEIVNAGVSGDTTAGGLARLDWILRQEPDIVVVALGGNDGLRGVDLASTAENLRRIVERSRAAGARVLLVGMQIPPNYGADYTERFAGLYPRLAEEAGVPLLPFLLEGVGGDPALNQPDGIHPTAEGQEILAENMLEALRPLLDELSGAESEGSESRDDEAA